MSRNRPKYTPEVEREIAHSMMHDVGAHSIVVITVYPYPHGTRISTIVSHDVDPRAYPSLVQALLSAFESAKEHVQKFLAGARGDQPIEVRTENDDDTPLINTTPKKPNKLVH